jgi:multiple sugar transport system permease protein
MATQTIAPKKSRAARYRQIYGILLILPWLIGLLLFKLIPIIASLGISFTDFQLLTPELTTFAGLDNYLRFFRDEAAGFVLFETITDALTVIPLQLGASLVLAALLSSPRLFGKNGMRTLFFLPSIIPSIAILAMWFGFTDPNTGWLNRMILEPLGLAGQGGINLFAEGAGDFVFAISSLWSIGPGLLIMMGAMQSISTEVVEASRVDGAGPFVRFFNITLPLISPAIFFALIINLITVFGGVVLLDRGNVFSGASSPYDGYLGFQMFRELDYGYAAALAWMFFIFVMLVTVFLFGLSRRWVFYAEEEN